MCVENSGARGSPTRRRPLWPEARQCNATAMTKPSDRILALSPEKRALLAKALQKQMDEHAREPVIKQGAPAAPPSATFDVAVLGGGLAGQTLARQIQRQRPSVRI